MEEEALWSEFIHARVQCNLEVVCPEDEKSVKISMQNLRKYVSTWMIVLSTIHSKISIDHLGVKLNRHSYSYNQIFCCCF